MAGTHVPVLADEVLEALNINPDAVYLDATYGRGGHSELILQRLSRKGRLLVIDRDPTAIEAARERHGTDQRVLIEKGVFANVGQIAASHGLDGQIAGALFDLGVSSPQLDDAGRGFSFSKDGPLDMRMSPDEGIGAADWLAVVSERELITVLKRYGEERQAARIAQAIISARNERRITSTAELAGIITSVVRFKPGAIHPATKSFQAIRIALNDELNQISIALTEVVDVLARGGRLAVIAFHSLEDRIVKRFMRRNSEVAEPYRGLPEIPLEYQPLLATVGRLIRASETEEKTNPRARSARLRVAEKVRA